MNQPTPKPRGRNGGRKPLPKGRARGKRLVVLCTPSELRQVETSAKRARQTVPDYVRGLLFPSI